MNRSFLISKVSMENYSSSSLFKIISMIYSNYFISKKENVMLNIHKSVEGKSFYPCIENEKKNMIEVITPSLHYMLKHGGLLLHFKLQELEGRYFKTSFQLLNKKLINICFTQLIGFYAIQNWLWAFFLLCKLHNHYYLINFNIYNIINSIHPILALPSPADPV